MKQTLKVIISATLVFVLAIAGSTQSTFASNISNITQTINASSLVVDIRDASGNTVASPAFGLSALNFSFSCQTSTGTLGTNTQRIYVDNPSAANNGWTVTIAATAGNTATWNNTGASQKFDYNDPTSAGCTDGADADSVGGQMTLDPSVGTVNTDCTGCSLTGITKGSSTAFSQGTTDSVTLLNASAASDDIGRWYLTGVGISQTIPGQQAVDTYSLNMTATITAS